MACHVEKNIDKKIKDSNRPNYNQITLVGNPNVGKSQIFNILTNSHELVGNFPGITVSIAQGVFKTKQVEATLIDLPGSYSLSNSHNVERITRDWIIDNKPDLIVNVIDSSNLERNLILTMILMEFGIPLVLVLNMIDIAKGKGIEINADTLMNELNIPVYSLVAISNDYKTDFKQWFENQVKNLPKKPKFPGYNQNIRQSITKIDELLFSVTPMSSWYSCKLLEGNEDIYDKIKQNLVSYVSNDTSTSLVIEFSKSMAIIDKEIDLFKQKEPNYETIFFQERHNLVKQIVSKVQTQKRRDRSMTQHLDIVLTNKYLGIPIFVLIIWIMFQFTFEISQPFVDYITIIMGLISNAVVFVLSPFPHSKLLISFINDGIISGTGTVLSFLPIVFFLFIVIAILEDSGYFSRGSFIVDKIMVQFGLEGRSFVPMVLGFGCNIPGILSTRNIEGKRERLLTISILPFMSCSARLPIYILFGSIFFLYNATELILFLYLLGVLIGLCVVLLFKLILKKKNFYSTPLILEMPPYIMPSWNSVISKSVTQVKSFIKKITSIVLLGSAIIWVLSHITLNPLSLQESPAYNQTLLGMIGIFIQPIFEPLGFNWKLVVALIFGLMAKEVIISTLGILYLGSGLLAGKLSQIIMIDPSITPLVALTYMIFILLYIPCIATVGIIKSETNKKFASFVVAYTLIVAYFVSWVFYTIGTILL